MKIFKSSAYRRYHTCGILSEMMSFMKMIKSIGPKCDRRGTPEVTSMSLDLKFLDLNDYFLPIK